MIETPPNKKVQKLYSIVVGETGESNKVYTGKLEKGRLLSPEQIEVLGKKYYILPTCTVWAQKLLDAKENYTGQLKFLPYGHEDGELIPICYRKNFPTLDKNYQDNVLKLKPLTDLEKQIELVQGIMQFDEVKEKNLIAYLKVCRSNADSKSVEPQVKKPVFAEYDASKSVNSQKEMVVYEEDSARILREAADSEGMIKVLSFLFDKKINKVAIDTRHPKEENETKLWAKRNHDKREFCEILQDAKQKAESSIEKAMIIKSCKFEDGYLQILENGSEWRKAVAAKDKNFFMKNFFEAEYYEAYLELIQNL